MRLSVVVFAAALMSGTSFAAPKTPAPSAPLTEGLRVKEPTELNQLHYRGDLRKAVDHVTKWFWAELGVEPPLDLIGKYTFEETQDAKMRHDQLVQDEQDRLYIEKTANRSWVIQEAQRAPALDPWTYEENIAKHARLFEYYMDIADALRTGEHHPAKAENANVWARPSHPLDPMRPEQPYYPVSAIEAEILALREIQYAYVESEKYSGWTPRLEKVAAWTKSITEKFRLWAPRVGAAVGAYYIGGTVDMGDSPQLAAQSMAAVTGGVVGYSCTWLLAPLPKGVIANGVMPYVNDWLVPRYTRKIMNETFSSERAKKYLKDLEQFGSKKKRKKA